MRFGKRSLAGLAAGALAFTGLALAVAPSAQAAVVPSIYCANLGGGGAAGTAGDPTTIKPNCVLPSALTQVAVFGETWYGLAVTQPAWLTFNVSGDSIFTDTAGNGDVLLSTDKKTASVQTVDLTDLGMTVFTPGVRTVTVTGGPDALIQNQSDLGSLTVTGTGTASKAVVSQGYYAVDALSTGDPALALVHVLDASGVPLDLQTATVSGLTFNTSGGTVAPFLYAANDCDTDGLLGGGYDAGGTADNGIVTDACDAAVGAGVTQLNNSGMWFYWTGPGAAGSYTASAVITVGANSYPVSFSYVVSSTLAGPSAVAFGKNEYDKGASASVDVCVKDLAGRIVPDGDGWASLTGGRTVTAGTNAPIYDSATGLTIAPDALFFSGLNIGRLGTYNGCNTAGFIAPPTALDPFKFSVTNGTDGWAAAVVGQTTTGSTKIGGDAVTTSIMIVGERGKGDNANMVFVEGTTTGLSGKTVTPFFRFPGQTGFTAGSGTRTVDAQGNFDWKRKTGKQIAVQFRGDSVVSNTVIIAAK